MEQNEQASYKFFANTECRYYPCHQGVGESFNCLFCYCPLYALGDKCGGNFEYLPSGVKSCAGCTVPHGRDGYERVMAKIGEVTALASRNRE